MHVMSPPGFSSTCSSSSPSYSDSVPAPTACCLEISSLVPCIGFASPLLPSPPLPPAAVVAETAKYVQCESADVLEQLPAGSLSKLHKCQLVSSYRTLSSSLLPFFPFSPYPPAGTGAYWRVEDARSCRWATCHNFRYRCLKPVSMSMCRMRMWPVCHFNMHTHTHTYI